MNCYEIYSNDNLNTFFITWVPAFCRTSHKYVHIQIFFQVTSNASLKFEGQEKMIIAWAQMGWLWRVMLCFVSVDKILLDASLVSLDSDTKKFYCILVGIGENLFVESWWKFSIRSSWSPGRKKMDLSFKALNYQ